MKYIMFEVRAGRSVKVKVPVIFSEYLVHADVAKALAPLGGKIKMKPVSAGFIDIKANKTYGRSVSLDLGIAIGDCEIIERLGYTQGIVDPRIDTIVSGAIAKAENIVRMMKSNPANGLNLDDPSKCSVCHFPIEEGQPRHSIYNCHYSCADRFEDLHARERLVCPVCDLPDTRPDKMWYNIYECHADCAEEYEARLLPELAPKELIPDLMVAARGALEGSRQSRTKGEGTLSHVFTHQCNIPAVIPSDIQMSVRDAKPLLSTCERNVQALLGAPPSSPLFKRVQWHAKLAVMRSQRLTQAYLFHAYQLASLSEWDEHSDKVECMNLINVCQTIDPHNELRGKVFTVNNQQGTVTTHSLLHAKTIANSRAEK